MLRSRFRPMALLGAGIWLALAPSLLPAAEKTELRGVGQFEIPAWFKSSFLDLPQDVAEAARGGTPRASLACPSAMTPLQADLGAVAG